MPVVPAAGSRSSPQDNPTCCCCTRGSSPSSTARIAFERARLVRRIDAALHAAHQAVDPFLEHRAQQHAGIEFGPLAAGRHGGQPDELVERLLDMVDHEAEPRRQPFAISASAFLRGGVGDAEQDRRHAEHRRRSCLVVQLQLVDDLRVLVRDRDRLELQPVRQDRHAAGIQPLGLLVPARRAMVRLWCLDLQVGGQHAGRPAHVVGECRRRHCRSPSAWRARAPAPTARSRRSADCAGCRA